MKNSAIWSVVLVLVVLNVACAKAEEATPSAAEVITNSIGMKLTQIPAGEFMMGSPDSDSTARSIEKPQHRVRITKPFCLGVTEVTQGQYADVMGTNPSRYRELGPDAPVESVTWHDAQEFCRKLSNAEEEKAAGQRYRLPTEAEWEYACRAGSTGKYFFGDNAKHLGDYAWYWKNFDGKTHPVGLKKPNGWGLYDMIGNVWEWCADWYDEEVPSKQAARSEYYANSPTNDPTGPSGGSNRALRGGSLVTDAWHGRSAFRDWYKPDETDYSMGFRVCLVRAEHAESNNDETIHLFNKKDLSRFYTYLKKRGRNNDPKKVFTIQDGVLRISGEEWGLLTTEEEYTTYRLVVEYKWGDETFPPRENGVRDSGVWLHAIGEDGAYRGEGNWMRGIEANIIEGGTGDLKPIGDGSDQFSLTAHVAPKKVQGLVYQADGRKKTINLGRINWWGRDPGWNDTKGFRGKNDVEKPLGEWNRYELVVKGPSLDVFLNGVLVNQAVDVKPQKGRIGFQSEGAEIFFRRIDLVPFPD